MTLRSASTKASEPQAGKIILVVASSQTNRQAACAATHAALPEGAVGKLQPERVIHATLVLAGSADDPRTVPVAKETAGLIRLPPFDLVFDTLTGFGGAKGVLALTCSTIPPEWAQLRKQLTQVPRRLGIPVEGGATPHLTMGYGFNALPAARLPEPVVWTVDGFRLIHSMDGEHRDLAEWPLR